MLSVLGIALAIACVTVVRTISASFAITGADSVTDVLGGAQLWAVPAAGVEYDADAQALVADGPAPAFAAPEGGSRRARCQASPTSTGITVSLRGNDETPSGQAVLGSALAERLGVKTGDRVVVGGPEPCRRRVRRRAVPDRCFAAGADGRRRQRLVADLRATG